MFSGIRYSQSSQNTPMMQRLGGFSSDHTWRGISADFENTSPNTPKLTLRGVTWNTLNIGHSKAALDPRGNPKGYSNNPFNLNESPNEYLIRKRAQIAELTHEIIHSQGTDAPLDFIFLQEVDWLQVGVSSTTPEEEAVRKTILSEMKAALSPLGYELEVTQHYNKRNPAPAGYNTDYSQQPLVTIYNKNTLQLRGSQGAFPLADKNNPTKFRYRGYESQFIHKQTGLPVTLTNLHLDYAHDYRNEIDTYLKQKTAAGQNTLMGGDYNHPQNVESEHLIADWHRASNFEAEDDNNNNNNNANQGMIRLTDNDPRGDFKKSYDGFFATPGGSTTRVLVTETTSKFFELNPDKTRVTAKTYVPDAPVHTSLLGTPWRRTIYILRDMDMALKNETNPVLKQQQFQAIVDLLKNHLNDTLDTQFEKRRAALIHARQYQALSMLLGTPFTSLHIPLPNLVNLNPPNMLLALVFNNTNERTQFCTAYGFEVPRDNTNNLALLPKDVLTLNPSYTQELMNQLLAPLMQAAPGPSADNRPSNNNASW